MKIFKLESLIDMYSKCGEINEAYSIFNKKENDGKLNLCVHLLIFTLRKKMKIHITIKLKCSLMFNYEIL